MRILHTADWHIGLISWKSSKPTDRSEEIATALHEMIEKASKLNVDLILVAGDLIDSFRSPSLEAMKTTIWALKELSKIAPVAVILGNHDWPGIGSLSGLLKDVHFLGMDGRLKEEILEINSGTVSIFPIPYIRGSKDLIKSEGYTQRRLLEMIQEYDSNPVSTDYRLLLGHVAYRSESFRIHSEESGEPVSLEESAIVGTRFSYVALGHYHDFTILLDHPKTVYSGSLVQTSFSDTANKGFVIADLDRDEVEFVEVTHKKLEVIDVRNASENEILEKLEESNADYIKIVLGKRNGYLADKLLKITKVRSVEVKFESGAEMRNSLDFSKPMVSVIKDYLKENLRLPKEDIDRALKLVDEAIKRTTA